MTGQEPEQWRSGDETGDNDDPDKGLLVPASQHNVGTASTTELCKTPTQVGGEETGLGSLSDSIKIKLLLSDMTQLRV